jgi:hypothetical protein
MRERRQDVPQRVRHERVGLQGEIESQGTVQRTMRGW